MSFSKKFIESSPFKHPHLRRKNANHCHGSTCNAGKKKRVKGKTTTRWKGGSNIGGMP